LELYTPTDSRYSPRTVVSRDIARYRTHLNIEMAILEISLLFDAKERGAKSNGEERKGIDRDRSFLKEGVDNFDIAHFPVRINVATWNVSILHIRPSFAHASFGSSY